MRCERHHRGEPGDFLPREYLGEQKVADVRVLAATNRDLRRAIAAGEFRADLFYRLNVVSLAIPPLRERREDLPALIEVFLDRYACETGRQVLRMGEDALDLLLAHDWPGNVRELQNAIERAVVLSRGEVLEARNFPEEIRRLETPRSAPAQNAAEDDGVPLADGIDAYKIRRIRTALDAAGGSQTGAAKLLGMRQSNLSRLMRSLKLKA